MASQVIGGQAWPDGTTVSVYPAAALVGAAPSGPPVTSGVVAAGAVSFTSVPEGVRLVAYALGRGIRFLVPSQASGGDRGRIEALEGDVAAGVAREASGVALDRWAVDAAGQVAERSAGVLLATDVQTSREAWLASPELAANYDRLRVYDTENTRGAFASLLVGAWRDRTWQYVNAMDGQNHGLTVGDTANPLMSYAVGGSPGNVRVAFAPTTQTAMDVRNAGWRAVIVAACVEAVNVWGHRGVFLDDFSPVPSLVLAPGMGAYATPAGWAAGMVSLAAEVRAALPAAEIVINLSPYSIAWNGSWNDYARFAADASIQQLLQLGLIWEIERGFSDSAVKASEYHTRGLAQVLDAIHAAGCRAILDDQSGVDGMWQRESYTRWARPGWDWLAPSAPVVIPAAAVANRGQGQFLADYTSPFTPDCYSHSSTIRMVLGGALTVSAPTNPGRGLRLRFIFQQDATGGRVVTWDAAFKVNWTPTTAAGKVNTVEFEFDGSSWVQVGSAVGL